MIEQESIDWLLLIGRWVHITVAISWIGTSVFFMWMDRTFCPNPENKNEGHIGELWMVHGGGFYKVEKILMGPTKVPKVLHWFKWESYWTWMSGMFLLVLTYYTGSGTYLLDESISNFTFLEALGLCLFSIFGSFLFYDFIWERKVVTNSPLVGHFLTLTWFTITTYILCKTISGRAAYIHVGAMLGTWMAGNVFLRIIPRQVKMVEASKSDKSVNPNWGKNAKNRSTHNTYFTLPVIFIMLSNHFPATYGHEYNWFVLLLISGAGALIREYFIIREKFQAKSKTLGILGILLLIFTFFYTRPQTQENKIEDAVKKINNLKNTKSENHLNHHRMGHHKVVKDLKTKRRPHFHLKDKKETKKEEVKKTPNIFADIEGKISLIGTPPKGKKLRLPGHCSKMHKGTVYSDEIISQNGRLANVLVRISKGLEGLDFPSPPKEEVLLDQRGCMYYPKMIAARVGQPVKFKNSDKLFHNVKSVSKMNKGFNLLMPKYNQTITKVFNKPELFLQTKCSVHPWMKAYVAILDHPYFFVSKRDGTFKIKKLPKGKYTIEFWHEVFGTQTKTVEVTKKEVINIDISFNVK